ncbi:hypothetical protein CJ739_3609 [Mariniflexile rhizosphaerae]|nr:hypothetical protein CJ739_3609 [Mariniflexile sp. TRM1-10]
MEYLLHIIVKVQNFNNYYISLTEVLIIHLLKIVLYLY